MSKLEEILGVFDNLESKKARLYFVTRELKPGLKKTSKATDRFVYKCLTIETDTEIQTELFSLFHTKLKYISNEEKYLLTDYALVTDDADKKIMTYSRKEKMKSFIHIVDEDLYNAAYLEAVTSLDDIADKLWAYIIEVYVDNKSICALRKMSPSKVMIGKKGLFTSFRTKDKTLELFSKQTVLFDKNIDALYCDNTFFVVSKDNFEEIVGLQDEYKEEALAVADKIVKSPHFSLGFNLNGEIVDKNRFIRKLAKIREQIDEIDSARITAMQKVARDFKQEFTVEGGKIVIRDVKELDVVIKLLDDYFVQSPQTGKKYGASVKTEI